MSLQRGLWKLMAMVAGLILVGFSPLSPAVSGEDSCKYIIERPKSPIIIDGEGSDFGWRDGQHIWHAPAYITIDRKEQMLPGTGVKYPEGSPWKGKEDLSVKAVLQLDEKAFYFLAEVVDDLPFEEASEHWWENDNIELFLSLKPHDSSTDSDKYIPTDYQIVMELGDGKSGPPGAVIVKDREIRDAQIVVKGRQLQLGDSSVSGYVVEAKFPLENFPSFKPEEGHRITVNLVVNDRDGGRWKHCCLSGIPGYGGSTRGYCSAYIYKIDYAEEERLKKDEALIAREKAVPEEKAVAKKEAIVVGELLEFGAGAENLPIPDIHIPQDKKGKKICLWDMDIATKEDFYGRDRICLNGIWACQRIAELPEKLSDDAWYYSVVPDYMWTHHMDANFYKRGKELELDLAGKLRRGMKEFYVYERQFSLPPSWKGEEILLDMSEVSADERERAKKECAFFYRIYLNEKPVASWKSHTDLKAYLTDNINFSGLNRLTIVKKGAGGGWPEGFGDIWLYKKTKLEAKEAANIESCFIKTSVKGYTVSAEVEIKSDNEDILQDASLSAIVYNWKDKKKVYEILESKLQGIEKGKGVYELSASWQEPVLWSPENPHLYTIQIILKDNQGQVIDNFVDRFGFRETTIKGKEVLLNGYPVHFRVVALSGDYESRYAEMKHVKELGFNTIFDFGDVESIYLDWADELGLMYLVAPGGVAIAGKPPTPEGKLTQGKSIIQKRNHPCIVCWIGIICEIPNGYGYWNWNFHKIGVNYYPDEVESTRAVKERSLDLLSFLQKYDPTRPVIVYTGGSIGPVESTMSHCDFGLPLQEAGGMAETWARQKDAKPYISLESWIFPGTGVNLYKHYLEGGDKSPKIYASKEETEWGLYAEQAVQYLGEEAYRLAEPYRTYPLNSNSIWISPSLPETCPWDYPEGLKKTNHWLMRGYNSILPGRSSCYSLLTEAVKGLGTWEHACAERGYGITGYWHFYSDRTTFPVSPNQKFVKEGINKDFTWWYKPVSRVKLRYLRWDCLSGPSWVAWDPDIIPENMPYIEEMRAAVPVNPCKDILLKANAPLLLFIGGGPGEWDFRHKDHAFFSNELVQKQVVVVNDLEREIELEVKWELIDNGGTIVKNGFVPVRVGRGKSGKFPFSFTSPEVSSDKRYKLNLYAMDKITGKIYDDTMGIEVFAKEKAPSIKAKIACYDEKGVTSAMLREAGIKFKAITEFNNLNTCDILIIGRQSLSEKIDGESISKAITEGLKLVVFEQDKNSLIGPWLKEINLRNQFIITPNHVLLSNLTDADFAHWRGSSDMTEPYPHPEPAAEYGKYWEQQWPKWGNEGMVSTFPLRRPQHGNYHTLLSGGFDEEYAGLVEFLQGKGVALFCQLDITNRYGKDPVATRLMHRMLTYLATFKPEDFTALTFRGNNNEESLLKRLNARIEKKAEVLVIGPGLSSESIKEWLTLVRKNGKTLLLLWPDEKILACLPFPVKVEKRNDIYKTVLSDSDKKHYLLKGISTGDFYWRFKREQNVITAIPGEGRLLAGGLLADIPYGSGRIIILQVNPDDHVKERSFKKSIRLLANLLTNLGVNLNTRLRLKPFPLELSQREWLFKTDLKGTGRRSGWEKADYDDSAWKRLLAGKSWELQGINEENPSRVNYPRTSYNGVAWYRIKVDIPDEYRDRELHLIIGGIRGEDKAYFNGVEIGMTTEKTVDYNNYWCCFRDYKIPQEIITEGSNQVAISVNDLGGPGGITEWPVRIMAVDAPTETVLTPMEKDNFLYDPYRFAQW